MHFIVAIYLVISILGVAQLRMPLAYKILLVPLLMVALIAFLFVRIWYIGLIICLPIIILAYTMVKKHAENSVTTHAPCAHDFGSVNQFCTLCGARRP